MYARSGQRDDIILAMSRRAAHRTTLPRRILPIRERDPQSHPRPAWRILGKKRARRLALVAATCRGTETCVPSEIRNRLSPSHWCNGRASVVRGEQDGQRSSRLRAHVVAHWRASAAMSRYTATGAPRAGMSPVRQLVRAIDCLVLRGCAEGACERVPPVDASDG